ncbi:hypothetical protein AB205_0016410, partial [Aquarana catesbeiana]
VLQPQHNPLASLAELVYSGDIPKSALNKLIATTSAVNRRQAEHNTEKRPSPSNSLKA